MTACNTCGADGSASYHASGHYYVGGRICPLADGSAIPLEIQRRRAGGELVDADGWSRRADPRDEALEEMRSELAAARRERDRWRARVLELEARLEAVRGIIR